MTGYGRMQEIIDGRDIQVEIRSVNHRFFEFSAKVPRAYGYLEDKLKNYLQGSISRGKVEVCVTVFNVEGKDALIEINRSVASGYVTALREANEYLHIEDDLSLSSLLRLSDIFNVRKEAEDEEVIWNDVRKVTDEALKQFIGMREAEGSKIKSDLEGKLDIIGGLVSKVEEKSPETTENYRARLYNKLKDVLSNTNIDEQRILTEAAIFAEKTAVDEETVRLRSHISQFTTLMQTNEPVGKKLDFLIQEFNREANTIGSKAQNAEITAVVVDLKSEIEKIREQIQNIE